MPALRIFAGPEARQHLERALELYRRDGARPSSDGAGPRAASLGALQASLGLTASLDLQTVLKAILQSTMRMVPNARQAFIFLYRAEAGGRGRGRCGRRRSKLILRRLESGSA